jgi:hypothetical protein
MAERAAKSRREIPLRVDAISHLRDDAPSGTPEVNSVVPLLARSLRDRGHGTPEVNSVVPPLARSLRDRGYGRAYSSRGSFSSGAGGGGHGPEPLHEP